MSAQIIQLQQHQNALDLDQAAELWKEAKRSEEEAKAARELAEQRLFELVNNTKLEGTEHLIGNRFKVTVTNKLNRTVDDAALATLHNKVPRTILEMCFKWKPSLDLSAFRAALTSTADYIPLLQSAVTCRPAKAAIKVESL